MRPLVAVIIVTYNSRELIKDCLLSISSSMPETACVEIHISDNGSSDDTIAAALDTKIPFALHEMGANAGFAAANNTALKAIDADFVLLLNPDARLQPGVLDRMIEVMRDHVDVGMAGCRLVQADGSFDHAAKRSIPTVRDSAGYLLRPAAQRRAARYTAPEIDEFGEGQVGAINGAFMFARMSAIEEVGLLDEAYWMYGEDLDWCLRFAQSGWMVYYVGQVTAIHFKSATSGRYRSPRLNWHFHRSMIVFYHKFYGGNGAISSVVYTAILARCVVKIAIDAKERRQINGGVT